MNVKPRRHTLVLALSAMLVCGALTACATPPPGPVASTASPVRASAPPTAAASPVAARPAQGQAIFEGQVPIDGFIACRTCHTTDPTAPGGAGPNLAGIATRGAERVPGLAAPEYIGRSIRVHDEHIVPGYAPGLARAVVGRDFGEVLSDGQVEQLVAFLMTLDRPPARPDAAGGAAASAQPSASTTPAPSAAPAQSATPSPAPSATPAQSATPSPAPSATAAPSATPAQSATPVAPSAASAAPSETPAPTSAPPTSTSPPPPTATAAPAPAPTPTTPPPPPAAATPTAPPTVEALPGAPDDPELARYAPCVTCHNQHPLQVAMPHPLNPTCNECHRGAPNRIGCPSCHSMHGVEYHEPDPNLACTTCHT